MFRKYFQLFVLLFSFAVIGCSPTKEISKSRMLAYANLDTVKAQRFDMGKMWTFDNPPVEYFKEAYNFAPPDSWFDKVMKSALRFGNGCSSSFVSADGLIMTNHHCIRGIISRIEENEDENFLRDGFIADSLGAERKVPGLFVDQLLSIEDVTDEILDAMSMSDIDTVKVQLKEEKIDSLIAHANEENPDLIYRIVSFYNGGQYSLYGYKRYSDVRMVFAPDLRTAKLGGDYDNFTYPRHGLDCAFLRVYENDEPVNSEYYFKWSENGAKEGDAVFVVGNPGSTDRIKTMAQIEFERDVRYPPLVQMLRELYDVYLEKVKATDARDYKLIARLYGIGNALKVYEGTYKALLDPVLMARKQDFQNKFKAAVKSDNKLAEKYGDLWEEIKDDLGEARKLTPEMYAYSINPFFAPAYFSIAKDLIELAEQKKLPEAEREDAYKSENIDSTIAAIFPDDFDFEFNKQLLKIHSNYVYFNLGDDNKYAKMLYGEYHGEEAAEYALNNSKLTSKQSVIELANKTPEEILDSDDPFISYIVNTKARLEELQSRYKELRAEQEIKNQMLGKALYAVYGETIPPDATFTLRIADGVIKTYEYNGTIAPPHTTFYGSLEKYYSFNKQFPFNLPEIWENLPEEFDPSTPLDFISTNDIIGGNSGSPVINKDAEIVGLAFDGNIESLPGRFIYTTEANRTVSVHSAGMIEAIRDLYKFTRLSNELLNGKMEE